jgi:carbamoyl-phosphate synthase small subunit
MKRQLILDDGTVFIGEGFGANEETIGEVVFNTSMTGYQEILSDPSYCGQLVALTYPLVGNYGINRDDFESITPAIKAFIVREVADFASNWRNESTLDELLKVKGIPGLAGIDTRKLTRIIRQHGAMEGILCSAEMDTDEMLEKLHRTSLSRDQVEQVSTKTAYASPGRGFRVVLMDFGMKHGILRELNKRNCDVIVVPFDTSAKEIRRLQPDGIMLSNGPGDPKDVPQAIETIKSLIGEIPLFGICLGHQLFALACGGDSFKMKFGHRGGNHPVKDLKTGKVALTSQNHGYAVEEKSLAGTRLEVTHIAINDDTVEGLKHLDYPAFTVQYHPEASPGPEDSNYLFNDFMKLMEEEKRKELQHA